MLGTVSAAICVLVSSTGGIGGGGLLVPLYTLLLGLGKYAIPLSKATIFGASIANVAIQIRHRHPFANRPLIAFDIAAIFEPMTLAGTVLGVLLNAILPSALVTVLLVVLLAVTAQKTLAKGRALWEKESLALGAPAEEAAPAAQQHAVLRTPLLDSSPVDARHTRADHTLMDEHSLQFTASSPMRDRSGTLDSTRESVASVSSRRDSLPSADAILLHEARTPWPLLAALAASWLVVLLLALLRGGHGGRPLLFDVPCGSQLYWGLTAAPALAMLALTAVVAAHLRQASLRRVSDPSPPAR